MGKDGIISDEATLSVPCRVCGRLVDLEANNEGLVLKCPHCGARSVFGRPVACPVCGHERVLARHKHGKPIRCPMCRAVGMFGAPWRMERTSGTWRRVGNVFEQPGKSGACAGEAHAGRRGGAAQRAGRTTTPRTANEEEQKHAEVLGLRGQVTASDVRSAYRELMAIYHPDRFKRLDDKVKERAERKAGEVNAAYEYFCKKYDIK